MLSFSSSMCYVKRVDMQNAFLNGNAARGIDILYKMCYIFCTKRL